MPVRAALAALGEALAREMAVFVRHDTWIYDLEPRAKLVGALVLIFGTTLINGLIPLALLLAALLALAFSNKIHAARLAKVWLSVPLFGLAAILPAITNLVTDGPTVVTLWHFGVGARIGSWMLPESLTITQSGLIVAGRILLRSVDCVTAAHILLATTEQTDLVNGLRRLGLPKVFGMVLTMMHRYLAVILRAAAEIHLAKLSRSISSDSMRREQRWVGAGIGILFCRTHRLSSEVYAAMLSRGYDGDIQVAESAKVGLADVAWLAGTAAFMAALVFFDRMF